MYCSWYNRQHRSRSANQTKTHPNHQTNLCRCRLVERALSAEHSKELALRRILEDQKHSLGVVKVAVQAQNIRVAQVRLNLYLTAQLVLDVCVLQLALVQDLDK